MTQFLLRGGFIVAALIIALFAAASIGAAGEAVSSGTFKGLSNHVTTGGVSVVRGTDGYEVVLAKDFTFDGAPDPKLGFGNNGFVKDTLFSPLRSNTGEQIYKLPPNIDPTEFNEFYLWCEKFNVPLGVASLQ
ncbi:MAG: DM13 domain-containing protein [Alphaproteobacteria bacterium]|nr:DM13 domain-containing protein [Alphaproteobacteria bacterium]